MKKKFLSKKIAAASMITLAIMTNMLSGCSSNKEDDDVQTTDKASNMAQTIEQKEDDVTEEGIKNEAVIMVVGDADITYSEVVVYIMMLKQQYESMFSEDIWSFSVGEEESFEDMAKDEIINQIARLKIMGFEAQELGVSLNADEKLDIEDDAVEFLQNITMEDQEKYGITQNIVETIYKDNYLAQKVFDVVTADVDTQVSDEEARAVKIKQIKRMFNGVNRDGQVLEGTDEEKEKAKKIIDAIYESVVEKGKDFDYYANRYSDCANEESTILLGDLEENLNEVAFSLDKKEYSSVIEGENAYYILYCVDNNDSTNLEENRETIAKRRQDSEFSQIYSKWLGKYDTFIVTGLWNMIHFDEL